MIRGKCITHLDEYKNKKWPTSFVQVPDKGDTIRAKDGSTLVVVGRTYYEETGGTFTSHEDGWRHDFTGEPMVEIALHKPLPLYVHKA